MRRINRFFYSTRQGLAFLLLLCLLFTACRKQEAQENPSVSRVPATEEETESSEPSISTIPENSEKPEVTGEPDYGGTLKVSMVYRENYNPLMVTDQNTANALSLIYSPLLDMDQTGRVQPAVASEWEMDENNASAVLTIDPDAYWQNGEKVTAADVVFSIRTLQQAEASFYKACISNLKDAAALSDDQVQLWFTDPSPLNLNQMYFPVVSEDYYASSGNEEWPMGCGPYVVEEYQTMDRFYLEAYDDYYGKKPYIDSAQIILERSDACQDSFDRGVTNLFYKKDIIWKNYTNRANINLHMFTSGEMVMLTFNMNVVSDVNLRKAIAYAIDAQKILRSINVDKGIVSESPISPSRWYGPTNPSLYGYSPEKMAELIDLSERTTLTLLVNSEDDLQMGAAEEIKNQLEEQGFVINLRPMPANTYGNALNSRSFDFALETVTCDSDRDLRQFLMDYQGNHSGYVSEAMTALINRIPLQTEDSAIHQAFVDVSGQLSADLPVYCLFFKMQASMTGAGIYGSLEPTEHNVFRGLENLYMVTREAE